jgi:hypothetical protein
VHGLSAAEGEVFRTHPALLYNGRRVLFPVLRRPGRSVNHTGPFLAEVKERAELYLFCLQGLYGLLQGELHNLSTLPGLKPVGRLSWQVVFCRSFSWHVLRYCP